MTRGIHSDLAGEFSGGSLNPVVLVRVGTSAGDVRMWSGIGTLDYVGESWLGGGDFLGVSDIAETADIQANGITISLAGVASEMIDLALRQVRQGKIAEIYVGAMGDIATYGTAIVDGYSLHPDAVFTRASDATVVGADGVLDVVGADVPRFAHDPATLELLGYLGEKQSINLVKNSQDLSAPTWSKIRCSAASGVITATSSFNPYASTSCAVDASISYVVAADVSDGWFSLFASDGAAEVRQWFNADTGEVGSAQGSLACVVIPPKVNNIGKFRFAIAIITGASASVLECRAEMAESDEAVSVSGAGVQLAVTRFTIEAGNFETSYIETGGMEELRAADKLQIPLSDVAGYPDAGGPSTVVYEGWTASGMGGAAQYLVSLDDGTINNAVWLYRATDNTIQLRVVSGGVDQAVVGGPVVVGQKHIRVVAKLEGYNIDLAVWADGEIAATFYGPNASGEIPAGLTTLTVLDRSEGMYSGNGTCLGLWVYPWAAKKSDMRKLATGEIAVADYRKIAGGQMIGDAVRVFAGKTDVPMVEDSGSSCTIAITGESALVDLERDRVRRYTDQDQQAEHPGDLGFEFVTRLQEMEISWGQGLG